MTPEQEALIKKAHASLRGAHVLAGEGLYDFAASRAYYTMFYVAEALLLGQGLSFSKHSAVIAAFGQRLTKVGLVPAEFHQYLIDGQRSRNKGDYDIELGITEAQAAEQIAHAAQFLELAERLIGPVPPSPGENA